MPGEGLRFHHYSQNDGLVQNTVKTIVQDTRGFIWLGTEDGLHRFDGYEMAVYQARPGDEAGLQADGVEHLVVDDAGDLWIATYGGGVSRRSATTGKFTHFLHSPDNPTGLRSNFVFRLAMNSDGRVWVASTAGIDLLDPGTGETLQFPAGDASGLPSDDIWSLLVDSQGTVWLGAVDGLFIYKPQERRFALFRAGDERYEPFHGHTITALTEAPDGTLLAATKSGVYRLDGRRELAAHFGPAEFGLPAGSDLYIGRILITTEGEIWASGFSDGVYWWDERAAKFRKYRHDPADNWSLSDDIILSLFEDRTGIVWFGTETGGVSTFNPATRAFQHFRHQKNQANSLPNRVVWSIMEDRTGQLWIGTDGGLSRLDRQRGVYTHYRHDPENAASLSSPFVFDVIEDSRGRIWAGTVDGINRLDTATGKFTRFHINDDAEDAHFSNSISFLFEAGDSIWAGTAAGLFRL
ncbi:MAG TPA: two-component regulator propeller domain-containing protein, partial [Gammaproteobacteria bacterium]